MSNGVAISLHNVSFAVPKRFSRSTVNLLSNITLDIHPAEFVSILGRSGAGKSTLLHLMNGDFLSTAGELKFDGLPPGAYLPERRQSLAYRHRHRLFTTRSVLLSPSTPSVEPGLKRCHK
jgi:ABC-type bacteriocin/lantibiotic exporter with double-glycine peptidase domain